MLVYITVVNGIDICLYQETNLGKYISKSTKFILSLVAITTRNTQEKTAGN